MNNPFAKSIKKVTYKKTGNNYQFVLAVDNKEVAGFISLLTSDSKNVKVVGKKIYVTITRDDTAGKFIDFAKTAGILK